MVTRPRRRWNCFLESRFSVEAHGLLVILVIVVVIGLAAWSYYAAAQRRKALRLWAIEKGLTYCDLRRSDLDDRYPNFDCLQQGDNRYACNLIEGGWKGRKFFGFDYHYETHTHSSKGGRQTQHHHFSAIILTGDLMFKPLFIRPEGLWDKITEFVGYDDIDFESAEFSRKFYVKSPDKKWAYDVLHPRTMEFLLGCPMFSMNFDWNGVIVYRNDTFSPSEFESAADVVCGVLDRLPDYVIRQLREEFPTKKKGLA